MDIYPTSSQVGFDTRSSLRGEPYMNRDLGAAGTKKCLSLSAFLHWSASEAKQRIQHYKAGIAWGDGPLEPGDLFPSHLAKNV